MKFQEVKQYFEEKGKFFTHKQEEIILFTFNRFKECEDITDTIFKKYAYRNEEDVMFYPTNYYRKLFELLDGGQSAYLELELSKKYLEEINNE